MKVSKLQRIIQEELQKILQEQFGDPGAGPEIRFPTSHRTEGLSIGDEELRFAQIAQYNLDRAIEAYNYWGKRASTHNVQEHGTSPRPGWYPPEFNAAAAAIHQFRDELKDLGVNPGSVTGQRDPWTWVAEDPRERQRPATPWWPGVGSGPPVIYDREDVRGQFIQEELQKVLQEYDFGDRRAIGQRSEQLFDPLPADEMGELMSIVHGPRGSGTIFDSERLLGALEAKLADKSLPQSFRDALRRKYDEEVRPDELLGRSHWEIVPHPDGSRKSVLQPKIDKRVEGEFEEFEEYPW